MHPILFTIGDFYIGSYGLMMALGLMAASLVAVWRGRRIDLPGPVIMDTIFCAVVAGIVGSRLAYIVVNFRSFLDDPMSMILSRTYFVFLGGVLLAIPACMFYARWRKVSFLAITDCLAAGIPLGHAFGRLGCFLAGCCFGKPVSPDHPFAFLAVRFPAECSMGAVSQPGLAFQEHLHNGLIAAAAARSLPVWPVQLFESFGEILIFIAIFWVWKRRFFRGQILFTYLGLYGILRFSLEFLRGDSERGGIGPISTSQLISLILLAGAASAWFVFSKLPQNPVPATKPRARRK
jgi:phosphatidylglycerol:prolipoprotein diacylglycerol transferase